MTLFYWHFCSFFGTNRPCKANCKQMKPLWQSVNTVMITGFILTATSHNSDTCKDWRKSHFKECPQGEYIHIFIVFHNKGFKFHPFCIRLYFTLTGCGLWACSWVHSPQDGSISVSFQRETQSQVFLHELLQYQAPKHMTTWWFLWYRPNITQHGDLEQSDFVIL